nr:LptF/LptG family permease [Candidatus Cardinium hertigii]
MLRSFIPTFVLLLALVLFVLVIQMFFVLFSNIAGKGLGVLVYTKLLFYIGLHVFPNAFPIAALIASLIVFGNLSESFEFTAMRSVGLSLQRILCFPFVFVLFLSGVLLYFQDYIHPTTNHKIFSLIIDVMNKKSALFIQQGVICNNIPGYSIHVNKKLGDNEHMEGIIVYDYTKTYGTIATIAEKGKLYTTPDEAYLVMELSNGCNYVEKLPDKKSSNSDQKQTFYRKKFLKQKIRISLEALKLRKSDEKYTSEPRTRDHLQLKKLIQEIEQKIVEEGNDSHNLLVQQASRYGISENTFKPSNADNGDQLQSSFESSTLLQDADFIAFRNQLIESKTPSNLEKKCQQYGDTLQWITQRALRTVEKIKTTLTMQHEHVLAVKQYLNQALFEKERRFAIAMRCVIMFLLAAPLGCIIRRGGFGVSVMISFVFILLEYILTTLGETWAIANTLSPFICAWLANFTVLPFCFLFLIKAQRGTSLFTIDWQLVYLRIKKIIQRRISIPLFI